MALAPLATTADLTTRGIDVSDTAKVDALLDAASDRVRDAAGSPIAQTIATVSLPGTCSARLEVPVRPVVSVQSASVDGTAVTDFKLVDGALWRAAGWQARWDGIPSTVTVTLTAGLAEVPADIVDLVCSLVAAALAAELGRPAGVQSESIDDYQVSYATGDEAAVTVMDLPDRTRAWLRSRFGGSAYVTGSR